MDPDPNKKKDQTPQKPPIKIKRINIPEHLRNKLNFGKATGQNADVHLGANVGQAGQAGLSGATSLSTMDPFIKVVADSNRGIILMPVLSDVTFSMPSSSIKSMLPDSSSLSLSDKKGLSHTPTPQDRITPRGVPSEQPDINTSKPPYISTGPSRSLSFPNFSNLSKSSFIASDSRAERDAFGNVSPPSRK